MGDMSLVMSLAYLRSEIRVGGYEEKGDAEKQRIQPASAHYKGGYAEQDEDQDHSWMVNSTAAFRMLTAPHRNN